MKDAKRGSRQPRRPARSLEAASQPSAGSSSVQLPNFPIRLADVLLYDLQIQRHPENVDPTKAPTLSASLNANIQRPIQTGPRLEIGLRIGAEIPDADKPAFSIFLTLNGVFEVQEGVDGELIEGFANTTALSLIWPYARETMQSLTLRMRIPMLVLPTLDIRNAARSITLMNKDEAPLDEEVQDGTASTD